MRVFKRGHSPPFSLEDQKSYFPISPANFKRNRKRPIEIMVIAKPRLSPIGDPQLNHDPQLLQSLIKYFSSFLFIKRSFCFYKNF